MKRVKSTPTTATRTSDKEALVSEMLEKVTGGTINFKCEKCGKCKKLPCFSMPGLPEIPTLPGLPGFPG